MLILTACFNREPLATRTWICFIRRLILYPTRTAISNRILSTMFSRVSESIPAAGSFSGGDNRDASRVRPTMQANVRFARVPVNGPAGPMVVASRPTVSINPTSSVQVDFNRPMNPGIDVMCQKQTACVARYLDDGRVIGRTLRI